MWETKTVVVKFPLCTINAYLQDIVHLKLLPTLHIRGFSCVPL